MSSHAFSSRIARHIVQDTIHDGLSSSARYDRLRLVLNILILISTSPICHESRNDIGITLNQLSLRFLRLTRNLLTLSHFSFIWENRKVSPTFLACLYNFSIVCVYSFIAWIVSLSRHPVNELKTQHAYIFYTIPIISYNSLYLSYLHHITFFACF